MEKQNLFKNNKVDYLTHFTNIYNLKSIIKNGILSVEYMNNNNIKYNKTDKNRFDEQLNFISISTNCINKKMLYKKICNNIEGLNIWIILILDLSLLDDLKTDIYFCYKNAASFEIKNILMTNKEKLNTPPFLNKFLISDDIQKEILVKNRIPIEYVKGIIVKNPNDKDIVNNILLSEGKTIPIICKRDMF